MNRTTLGLLAAAAVFSLDSRAENGVSANRILLGQSAVFSGPAAKSPRDRQHRCPQRHMYRAL